MEPIGLKEAVEALRKELSESILAAEGEALRFEVGQITLEMQVAVERKAEGSAGIKFWVVELGGKGTIGTTETHKVTIPLKPIGPQGEPIRTGRDTLRE